jgi:deoxyadenosine/deoxycytidine kinase
MYILEGNIGAGKTTFLTLLKEHLPEIDIMTEPVTNWNNESYGESLLANFYNDTPRWAFTLELLTMICRTRNHVSEQNNSNSNRILERSLYSGHYCFAKNCFESGFLTKAEWNVYNMWADFLINRHCRPPKGFIYLKADPQTCLERIKKRSRPSETSISIEYVRDIDRAHDNFLIEKKGIAPSIRNIPVLVLDCNEDFVENPKKMKIHTFKVNDFLQKTQESGSICMRPCPRERAKVF